MDSLQNQNVNDMCFVCGVDNPAGLRAQFIQSGEPGVVEAIFSGKDIHMSYPGRLHGGIAAAICDETIGRASLTEGDGAWGVTVSLSLRYRKPTPLHENLICRGYITKNTKRTLEGKAEIRTLNGEVCVTAEAKYMKLPVDTIVSQGSPKESGEDYVWEKDTRAIPEYARDKWRPLTPEEKEGRRKKE